MLILSIVFFFILFSCFLFRLISIEKNYNNFIKDIEKTEFVIGYINSYPKFKNEKFEFIFKVVGIKNLLINDYKKIKPVNILIKVKNLESNKLKRGDFLIIEKKINLPRIKIGAFKYREYLYYHKSFEDMKRNRHLPGWYSISFH